MYNKQRCIQGILAYTQFEWVHQFGCTDREFRHTKSKQGGWSGFRALFSNLDEWNASECIQIDFENIFKCKLDAWTAEETSFSITDWCILICAPWLAQLLLWIKAKKTSWSCFYWPLLNKLWNLWPSASKVCSVIMCVEAAHKQHKGPTCCSCFRNLASHLESIHHWLKILLDIGNNLTLIKHMAFGNRVLKWWCHKNDFSEIMGFIWLFRTTYLKKVHRQKNGSLVH